MAAIPALEFTEPNLVSGIASDVRSTFLSHKTRSLQFRLVQLRKLYWGLKDNAKAIETACKLDISKGVFESNISELNFCTNTIIYDINNLEKWAKDESSPDVPFDMMALRPKIRKDPLGAVLIIGPYNFPVNLLICPLAGAIAAGNTVVIKPSENAPNVAVVLQKVIEGYLDQSCYRVVQGAIPQSTALLEQKWDKIFYTGGATVGTIIAKKAAETLTPVTLELGGRNPAVVTRNADIRLAARRLLWGKVHNAGQVCISQNYTLIDKEVFDRFVLETRKAMKEYYPNGTRNTEDFGRIVNNKQWQRLKKMLDDSQGQILMGGDMDESDRYIEPTVIQVSSLTDSLIANESFGPLMPLLPVSNLDEAIRIVNEVQATPLAMFPFGNKTETDRCLAEIRSGGASVNDGFMHGSLPTLAFGGVGESGQGAYRGKASFDCFSHARTITSTPGWAEFLLAVRYPPYKGKLKMLRRMELKPDFDREGRMKYSLVRYILSLGAASKRAGLLRYLVVLISALGLKQYFGA
ncbi:MAG: hypothetical protein ASARMPRED_000482 [Alectoria sarmentosa]|nr:MAG: hypothetical protein ASARMPRED_000482 [Alectoria sarmentosa]